MSRVSVLFAAMATVMVLFSTQVRAEDADATGYKLLPGDLLSVSVWREEILDRELSVLPDGNITFPLAGRVNVAGLTTPQVEKVLSERLGQYLAEPVVTVSVSAVSGNKVYVVGKVTQPGAYIMTTPTTISQILSVVGAFDRFAELDEIKVLRGAGENAEYISFSYDDLVDGSNAKKATMLLEAGDVVIIP
ncbi:polysaccharide biosynthesis/export family protein [Hwanghaeella grinnelliae]|uniref:polysaccharide biosynthesis/export family protein n=1 Tax=Hwanghaeella grinnelliae TaxID=2500179 RepID=UPI001386A4D3|nr:polysaccharide biosynthesis/export family protein [Hwanghaeella grinnelliae]